MSTKERSTDTVSLKDEAVAFEAGPNTYRDTLPIGLSNVVSLGIQAKTDARSLVSDKPSTRSEFSLYSPQTHLLATVSSVITSALLFSVTTVLLIFSNVLPASVYGGQFTPGVWTVLAVTSVIATTISAIAWYTHSAPSWLGDHLRIGFGILGSVFVGSVLYSAAGAVGYYVSISAGMLVNLLAITLTSYSVYLQIVPHHHFQRVARTAVSIDQSLTAADFDLLKQHGLTVPHQRATARHLIQDDDIDPDQPTVLTLEPSADPETFATGYYQALTELSDALDDVENVQTAPGPLTTGVGTVLAKAYPSRLSTSEERTLATKLARAGVVSVHHYATLLRSGYTIQPAQFADLVVEADRSLPETAPPDRDDLEAAITHLHDLTTSFKLVERIDSVQETWTTQTDFDLAELIGLPTKPGQAGSTILDLEPRVSRAEAFTPLATRLAAFRSNNSGSAADNLGDAIEEYIRGELTAGEQGQPNYTTVESALDVGEKARDLAEVHPYLPFEEVLTRLAHRIRSSELSESELQSIAEWLDSLASLAAQLSDFRSRTTESAPVAFADAVEEYIQSELTTHGNRQPEHHVVASALDVGERSLALAESHPQAPFEDFFKYLAKEIRTDGLSESKIQTAENRLGFVDDIFKQVEHLRSTTDREIVNSFTSQLQRNAGDHLSFPENPPQDQAVLESAFLTCQNITDYLETYPEYRFDDLIDHLTEQLARNTLTENDLRRIDTTAQVADKLLGGLATLNTSHPSVPANEWRDAVRTALRTIAPERLEQPEQDLEQLLQMRDEFWDRSELMMYSPDEFEHVVAALYEAKGYDTTVSQYSADMGVDVWAEGANGTVAIQVKQYSEGNTVGRGALQKTASAIAKGDADQVVVVTSSSFAHTAEEYAQEFGQNLILIDGEEVIRQLSESAVPPPTSQNIIQ